jgi:surface antigen
MKISLTAGVLSCLLALSTLGIGIAQGANLGWLNHSPVRHFSDNDWEIMTTTAALALNDGAAGETFNWNNPETGNFGSLTALESVEIEGNQCRELQIINHARGLDGTSTRTLCRQSNGEWKLVR